MRPARPLALFVLLATVAVAGCDCESMLATRRRDGAPTTSEGRGWDEAPATAAAERTTRSPAPSRKPAGARIEAAPIESARIEAAPIGAAPTAADLQQLQPPRPTTRGGFDKHRPIKLPRNRMPIARFGGDPVQEQAAEPLESDDR